MKKMFKLQSGLISLIMITCLLLYYTIGKIQINIGVLGIGFVLTLLIAMIIYTVALYKQKNVLLAYFSALLLLISFASQVILDSNIIKQVLLWMMVGGILSVVFIFVYDKIQNSLKRFKGIYEVILLIIFLACFALLMIKAVEINGARLWIFVGDYSIQISEIMKFILLLLFASCFSNYRRDYFVFSEIVLIIACACFACLNELGTLLIILIVYTIAIFFFYPLKQALFHLLLVLLGLTMVVGFVLVERTYLCDMLGPLSTISSKLYYRVLAVFSPYEGQLTYAYQIIQARKGVVVGGLYGSDSTIVIPFETSDLALAGMMKRCGLVYALVLMFIYTLGSVIDLHKLARSKQSNHYFTIMHFIFILSFIVQAYYSCFANLGYVPLSGIVMPFISQGGSAYVINMMMFLGMVFLVPKEIDDEKV